MEETTKEASLSPTDRVGARLVSLPTNSTDLTVRRAFGVAAGSDGGFDPEAAADDDDDDDDNDCFLLPLLLFGAME